MLEKILGTLGKLRSIIMLKVDAASFVDRAKTNSYVTNNNSKGLKRVVAKSLNPDQFVKSDKNLESVNKYCSGGVL